MRYSKTDKEIGAVYTRVTIDGHRGPEWSLNIKVSKEDWDFAKQNVRPNNRNFQAYNTKINELIADINESYNEVKRSGKPVTAKRIVSFVRTRKFDFDFSTLQIPDITKKCLSEERDMFVWACYTGQHHGDYIQKSYEIFEYNGKMWLSGFRLKSEGGRKNKPYYMPLHPIALQILERYGSIEKLPVRNNSKRNVNLKVIAAYIGINQNLTTKVARKTLANYCLNDLSMRAETVAAVLGHSSTKHLKHYAKISNESICREMTFSDLTNEVQPLKQA